GGPVAALPGLARTAPRRQGRAAPLREHLPQRRGHPARKVAADVAFRGRQAHHRPRHRQRLNASDGRAAGALLPSPAPRRAGWRRAGTALVRLRPRARKQPRRALGGALPRSLRRGHADPRRCIRGCGMPGVVSGRARLRAPRCRPPRRHGSRSRARFARFRGAASRSRRAGGAARGSRAEPAVILDTVADAVGNTPMVRLPSLESEAPGVQIWAKLDWLNPGGSVKDRAGLFIIRDALDRGLVGPGKPRTLIDSTSGNTGIAYAWLGAALGVRVALVMPENVSEARKQLTRAYGAEQIFSDPLEQSDGAIRLCRELVAAEPERWFYADQYSNPQNPRAHERTTAEEIWRDTRGSVTHFVAGIGTGGTIMGTGRGLRRHGPVRIVGVEPAEALHGLEGLKHMPSSIVPPIYREQELDEKLSISTDAGWAMAERLIADEGL